MGKGQHRAVRAAEKYAELEAKGEKRPVCKCHGEPKGWAVDSRKRAGGNWYCRIRDWKKHTEYSRYHNHGTTKEACAEKMRSQNNNCACCGDRIIRGIDGVFAIDHDRKHCPKDGSCGKCIRGLVCRSCNVIVDDSRLERSLVKAKARVSKLEKCLAYRRRFPYGWWNDNHPIRIPSTS